MRRRRIAPARGLVLPLNPCSDELLGEAERDLYPLELLTIDPLRAALPGGFDHQIIRE